MCTPKGDMINLISHMPANKARKCLVLHPDSNQHVPALWIRPAKSFIQFAEFIILQKRYLTPKSGDCCCSDFSVSL